MNFHNYFLFFTGLLSANCIGQVLRFGSFPGVSYFFNHTTGAPWCGRSFECDMMSFLCNQLNGGQRCTLTMFDNLDKRITALEDDQVDIVISRFSVTPQRAERVDFIRPFYYSSGAQLFTLKETEGLFSSFDQLISQVVCMDLGYYVADLLSEEFGFFVFPGNTLSFYALLESGYCSSTITDSAFVLDGLVQANTTPIYEEPFGVAISKNPSRQNLKQDVQQALLKMFMAEDGKSSLIKYWESAYLLPQGLQQSDKLAAVGEAINVNTGSLLDAEVESEIWDAANISEVYHLFDDLEVVFFENEQVCEEYFADVYASYENGTSLDSLPMVFVDSLLYSIIQVSPGYQNLAENLEIVQHPFFPPGLSVSDAVEVNPQSFIVSQEYARGLAKQENRVDGSIWTTMFPFDPAAALAEEESSWDQVFSPTRLVKTSRVMTMNGRREDEGKVILITCGVGELRSW